MNTKKMNMEKQIGTIDTAKLRSFFESDQIMGALINHIEEQGVPISTYSYNNKRKIVNDLIHGLTGVVK